VQDLSTLKFPQVTQVSPRILILEYWVPLLAWLLLIYYFSTDNFSASETSGFIVPLLRFFFPGLSPDQLMFWHGAIRKLGHVAGYAVLGFLAHRAITFEQPDRTRAKLLTFQFVLLAAMADEFHQSLTISRSASFIDVGYDSLGGLLTLWWMTILRK